MSVITITTVGFGEVHPLSTGGRVFTGLLIILGVGAITYALSTVTNYVLAGEVLGLIKERRMRRVIESMQGHYVVCGFGELGRQVCGELKRNHRALVVVDISEASTRKASEMGYLTVHGDAGIDLVLRQAGIERASGLLVATDDDATNLLVVLTARVLNNQLSIVARANLEEVASKLHRAGADKVLFPHGIAGRRMAQMLINPEICDFLDVVTHDESLELLLENFKIVAGSPIEDQNLRNSRVRERTGASIVGLRRPGEGIIASLRPDTVLRAGDTVFALGTRDQVENLSVLLSSEQN
jgi:voltage-gated potassium channel